VGIDVYQAASKVVVRMHQGSIQVVESDNMTDAFVFAPVSRGMWLNV
jgi:hypothetical protein